MKTVGIITEYNPFHKGHEYHIRAAKEATGAENVVCVMIGNYVQRGEPALVNKWARAEIALNNGCDLVLELPCVFATAGAEYFSFGGVSALDATGIIDYLCFGSESGEINELKEISDILSAEPEEYQRFLRQNLVKGLAYAKARDNALAQYMGGNNTSIIQHSNNILAIEYLKALNKLNSKIEPITIKRIGAGYNDVEHEQNQEYASASYIRKLITNSNCSLEQLKETLTTLIPAAGFDILIKELESGRVVTLNKFNDIIMAMLRIATKDSLLQLPDVNEGLENRILKAVGKSRNLDEFFIECKTSRYTLSRIKRIVVSLLTGVTKDDLSTFQNTGVPYLKVLGFNNKGTKLLARMQNTAKVPVITKPAHLNNFCNSNDTSKYNKNISRVAHIEARSTDIYTLAYDNPHKPGDEFRSNPITLLD